VLLAETIRRATGGALDLMALPEVKAPATFGARIQIIGGVAPAFADCHVDAKPAVAIMHFVNRRFGLGLADYEKLDLKNGVLSYHLSTLEREGYVLSEMDGIYRRFYPNSVKFEVDYPIFLSKLQERIVDFIKSRPGLTQKEVAKELGISTSTANDNIQVLSQALILELKRDGKRTRCYLVET
jgi:predicted transcriptional regulator